MAAGQRQGSQICPGSRLLGTERKLLTHAIRMGAYNSESGLARLLRTITPAATTKPAHCCAKRLTLPGDLEIIGTTLHVRLDPASAPRRSKALAALAVGLTSTNTRYPGTNLTLAYSIKNQSTAA